MSAKTIAEVRRRYPNLQEWQTGGGCTGLGHPLDDGGHLLITDTSGLHTPTNEDRRVLVGRYTKDGDPVTGDGKEGRPDANGNSPPLPIAKLEAWIDAQLADQSEDLEDLDKHCPTCTCNQEQTASFDIATAPRALLIAFCEWNDRNGCFNDEAASEELGAPLTDDELRTIVRSMME